MNLEHYKNAFPLHLGSRFLLMCLSLMLILPLSAQETIGKVKKQAVVEDCHNTFNPTPEELEQILIQENQFQARKGQIMAALQEGRMPALAIPVQIHIVRRSDGTGGISEASILSEFNNYVTPRYAGANLTFTFCQATRYIDSDTYYFIGSDAESNTMSNTYNVPNVMNIYFVGDAQGYCGYAWFPSSSPDYIVIDNSCATNTSTLAHEIGHYRRGHIPKMIAVSALMTLGGFAFIAWLAQSNWFNPAFGFPLGELAPSLLLFGLLSGAVTFWLSPLGNYFSRKHEYEADAFARDAMGGPKAMLGALHKLAQKNLSNLTPHPWFSAFYYSHPTMIERERALVAEP